MIGIGIRARLSGVPRLVRKLAEVDEKVARKALKKGIDEATKPILKDARARVRTATKLLKKALGRRSRVYRKGVVVVGLVGVRKAFKGPKGKRVRLDKFRVRVGTKADGTPEYMDPTNYAHLVEFGTRPHSLAKGDRLRRKGRKGAGVQTKGAARHPGAKKYPFLRPARDANRGAAVRAVKRHLQAAIASTAAARDLAR